MKIIISPAKKMNIDTDSLPHESLPHFLPEAKALLEKLKSMDYHELKKLWACSDALAKMNFERLHTMDFENKLTPAILSYEGIQYQYMAPGVFEYTQYAYIKKHLYIVSGMYGLLRPFDGVAPYRLEMQAKLSGDAYKNLYGFWKDKLAKKLSEESSTIINLASKEYSKSISNDLPKNISFITCFFTQLKDGKLIEKGTECKMARGEMVRFMAENNISDPENIKYFDKLNYKFSDKDSNKNNFVFIKPRNQLK